MVLYQHSPLLLSPASIRPPNMTSRCGTTFELFSPESYGQCRALFPTSSRAWTKRGRRR
jgi:hypothetical protein